MGNTANSNQMDNSSKKHSYSPKFANEISESSVNVMFNEKLANSESSLNNNHTINDVSLTSDISVDMNNALSNTSYTNNFTGGGYTTNLDYAESEINVEFEDSTGMKGGGENEDNFSDIFDTDFTITSAKFESELKGGGDGSDSEIDSAEILNIITQLGGNAEDTEYDSSISKSEPITYNKKSKKQTEISSSSSSLNSESSTDSSSDLMMYDGKSIDEVPKSKLKKHLGYSYSNSDNNLSEKDINLLSLSEPREWMY